MTFLYSFDPDKKIAYLTLPEETNLAETLDALHQLVADERLDEGFGILVDVRVTNFIPTAAEARESVFAISRQAIFLNHPIAVVVSRSVQYGLSNMVSLIAELRGITIRPFYEVEKAEAWVMADREGGHS